MPSTTDGQVRHHGLKGTKRVLAMTNMHSTPFPEGVSLRGLNGQPEAGEAEIDPWERLIPGITR